MALSPPRRPPPLPPPPKSHHKTLSAELPYGRPDPFASISIVRKSTVNFRTSKFPSNGISPELASKVTLISAFQAVVASGDYAKRRKEERSCSGIGNKARSNLAFPPFPPMKHTRCTVEPSSQSSPLRVIVPTELGYTRKATVRRGILRVRKRRGDEGRLGGVLRVSRAGCSLLRRSISVKGGRGEGGREEGGMGEPFMRDVSTNLSEHCKL